MRRVLAGMYNRSIAFIGTTLGEAAKKRIDKKHLYFPYVSELLSQIPFGIGWKLRSSAYSRLLPSVGKDVVLHHGVTIEDQRSTFGSDIWVSIGSYIGYAIIEDHVLIGQNAVILAGGRQHNIDRLDIPIKQQGNPPNFPVRIGHGAWIGANSTIMADIGNDAIVGAGSVVTKPVPPFAIVAGNPARVLRMRLHTSVSTDNKVVDRSFK